jgi:hypothetical protein
MKANKCIYYDIYCDILGEFFFFSCFSIFIKVTKVTDHSFEKDDDVKLIFIT